MIVMTILSHTDGSADHVCPCYNTLIEMCIQTGAVCNLCNGWDCMTMLTGLLDHELAASPRLRRHTKSEPYRNGQI